MMNNIKYLLIILVISCKNKEFKPRFSFIDISCRAFAYEFYINIDSLGKSKSLIVFPNSDIKQLEFKIETIELDTLNNYVNSIIQNIKDTLTLNYDDNKVQYADCYTYNIITKYKNFGHKFYVKNNCLENKELLNSLNRLIYRVSDNIYRKISPQLTKKDFISFDNNIILPSPPPPAKLKTLK